VRSITAATQMVSVGLLWHHGQVQNAIAKDVASEPPAVKRSAPAAFSWGAPIGCLGGLIGLGGAEFRLPVLVQYFRHPAKQAVPLNLSVSLVTVVSALITRLVAGGNSSLLALEDVLIVIVGVGAGAVIGAQAGALWSGRISEITLRRTILALLIGIGGLLFVEAFSNWSPTALASSTFGNVTLGLAFGVGIGVVSSLLGVAGGELIIPTLILAFGVDIKVAGTASLVISLPAMLVGIRRHWKNQAFASVTDLRSLILPMGFGSLAGAVVGGVLVAYVSTPALKLLLGGILIASAIKVFKE
jgi:uncharacterized protein